MKAIVVAVATELFASQPVQASIVQGFYTDIHIAQQAVVAATAFSDVADATPDSQKVLKVAIGHFIARSSLMIIGGTPVDFANQAELAFENANLFAAYLAKIQAVEEKPQTDAGSQGSTQGLSSGEGSGSADSSSGGSENKGPAGPIATEDLGLAKKTTELLLAANLVNSDQILKADADGSLLAIDGIGEKLHKIIMEAVKTKTAPAE